MKGVIEFLERMKDEGDIYQYNFYAPVSYEELEKLENFLNGKLPRQYLEFLQHSNGGFICNGHWGEYIWETGHTSLPEDCSISLYSVDDLIANIDYVKVSVENCGDRRLLSHEVVPIADTPNGGVLVLLAQEESPVYFLCSKKGRRPQLVFDSFKSFFYEYIKREGYIKLLFD